MKKLLISCLFALTITFPLSICAYAGENEKMKISKKFLPPDALLISPVEPEEMQSVQMYDFDRDGKEEMMVTFEVKAKEQPAPSQMGFIVLKKETDGWKKIWDTTVSGVGLPYAGLADLTGDEVREFLFGTTIGASAGHILQIFQWKQASLQKIAEIPFHRLELINGEETGLAVWQRYIADTYFVDVLKWNGEKFVTDKTLYAVYYPVIAKFYKDKISNMDAWFYWYTLADAQIKANQLEKAAESIEKGKSLAKELSLPEIVEKFEELSEKLQAEK